MYVVSDTCINITILCVGKINKIYMKYRNENQTFTSGGLKRIKWRYKILIQIDDEKYNLQMIGIKFKGLVRIDMDSINLDWRR